jgi:cysteinyl-tRNA synthetase
VNLTICSSIFGKTLDIHSGGIDLKFPHHQNEIAQCHAYWNLSKDQKWVNYFLHVGHVHIEGRKMSKSLKNFVTIKEYLNHYTSRQFRILCLMSKYSSSIDYSSGLMSNSVQIEKRLLDFYSVVQATLGVLDGKSNTVKKWGELEFQLHQLLLSTQETVREHLATDFNTPAAFQSLFSLISATHSYLRQKDANSLSSELLHTVVDYVKTTTDMFGLDLTASIPTELNSAVFTELVNILVNFRSSVKSFARSAEKSELQSQILKECDVVRSTALSTAGIRIQDTSEGALWSLVDKNLLKQQDNGKLEVE